MPSDPPPDVTSIVGARPQFVKAAAMSRALREHGINERLVHTGQHYDENMSSVFFDELEIPPPSRNLAVRSANHGAMTGRMLEALEEDLQAHTPKAVVVYGDTNSTLAGALAGAKLHLPVVHVEAGLRSFNRAMPEEVNRVLTDHVSALLLCPTPTAVSNLETEGITHGVHRVGDVMYDATLHARHKAAETSTILERLSLHGSPYVVATVHRAENTRSPEALRKVAKHLSAVAKEVRVVLPLHPGTRNAFKTYGLHLVDVEVVEPVGYLDMAMLLMNAQAVHTDSGGLQKEAYFHSVPCVTLRNETEWIETVIHGWNRLWTEDVYLPRTEIHDYGCGDAAATCVRLIKECIR